MTEKEERRGGSNGDNGSSSEDQGAPPPPPANPSDGYYEFGEEPPERPEPAPRETKDD